MAVGIPEMGAATANNGGRLPLALDTPAVQNAIALADHRGAFGEPLVCGSIIEQ
jgi:hypothetical protein